MHLPIRGIAFALVARSPSATRPDRRNLSKRGRGTGFSPSGRTVIVPERNTVCALQNRTEHVDSQQAHPDPRWRPDRDLQSTLRSWYP